MLRILYVKIVIGSQDIGTKCNFIITSAYTNWYPSLLPRVPQCISEMTETIVDHQLIDQCLLLDRLVLQSVIRGVDLRP